LQKFLAFFNGQSIACQLVCLTKKSFVLSMQRILNAWGAFLNGVYDQLMTPKKLKIALESLYHGIFARPTE